MSDHVSDEFFVRPSYNQLRDEQLVLPIWLRITIIVWLSLGLWVALWLLAQSCARLFFSW